MIGCEYLSDQMHPVETYVIDEPQRVRGPLLYFVGRLAFARAHPAMIEGHNLECRGKGSLLVQRSLAENEQLAQCKPRLARFAAGGSSSPSCAPDFKIFFQRRLSSSAAAPSYNEVRTHLSLGKDAPCTRPLERFGDIIAQPIPGGLHHRYARI